ncbi:MAG: hypothetical protein E7163_05885 [Firmicutes bacterium]|nr:hypothetical protein [Bacillota bacterium]
MRDSIGGSILLNLVLIFTGVITVLFIGALSYSKAFNVKNRIIEIIEKYGVYGHIDDNIVNDAVDEINPDLSAFGYDVSGTGKCANIRNRLVEGQFAKYSSEKLSSNLNSTNYNYCVFEICDLRNENGKCIYSDGKYYLVVTFTKFEIPVIGDLLTFPVYGETRMLGKSYDY